MPCLQWLRWNLPGQVAHGTTRGVVTSTQATRPASIHWCASALGATPSGDGWLETTIALVAEAQPLRDKDGFMGSAVDRLGKRWVQGPTRGSDDACWIRGVMRQKGFPEEAVREYRLHSARSTMISLASSFGEDHVGVMEQNDCGESAQTTRDVHLRENQLMALSLQERVLGHLRAGLARGASCRVCAYVQGPPPPTGLLKHDDCEESTIIGCFEELCDVSVLEPTREPHTMDAGNSYDSSTSGQSYPESGTEEGGEPQPASPLAMTDPISDEEYTEDERVGSGRMALAENWTSYPNWFVVNTASNTLHVAKPGNESLFCLHYAISAPTASGMYWSADCGARMTDGELHGLVPNGDYTWCGECWKNMKTLLPRGDVSDCHVGSNLLHVQRRCGQGSTPT